MTLTAQIEATKQAVAAQKQAEENLRRSQPLIRFWDAEWQLQHVGGSEIKAQFSWISNDTGPGQVVLPFDGPIAQWIHDTEGRLERGEGRNVCITVDYCGARWSGVMDKYTVEQKEDGDVVLVVDFFHDYEHLKWTTIYSNPWFAPALQIPRAWVCVGPIDWALKTTLLVNLFRQHKPRATWPNDPLDRTLDWLDQSQWPMAVHPGSFRDAMERGSIWGVVTSRFGSWHDVAHILLEDAEMSVTCRRWLEGDPAPWKKHDDTDYIPRNGQLIIDIVDKSGIYVGTSHGGKLTEGLKRTIVEFADDFVDSTTQLMVDAEVPVDYYKPNSKYTTPEKPYVVFREGETSPIQTSQWIHSPAKGVQILVGGHSMPGVGSPPRETGGAGQHLANTRQRNYQRQYSGAGRSVGQPDPDRRFGRHHRHPPQTPLRRHHPRLAGHQILRAGQQLRLGTPLRILPTGSYRCLDSRRPHGAAGWLLGHQNHRVVEVRRR